MGHLAGEMPTKCDRRFVTISCCTAVSVGKAGKGAYLALALPVLAYAVVQLAHSS